MIRQLRILCTLVAVAVAVASCAPGVRAQTYSSVIVFGDSLSDSGNVAGILPGAAAGNGFTTNPDPIWAEIVAETFGVPGTHVLAGGSNYAIGGTCVDPDASCNFPAPKLGLQIDAHLSEAADADALYGVWAGLNDIDTIVNPDAGIPRVDPRTAIPASARALVDQIRRLQHGGARHILVFNLPDRSPTPGARVAALDNPHLPAALAMATTLYNEHLDAGIRTLDDGIVPINAHALFAEVLDDPSRYGFANIHDPACSPAGPNPHCGGIRPRQSFSHVPLEQFAKVQQVLYMERFVQAPFLFGELDLLLRGFFRKQHVERIAGHTGQREGNSADDEDSQDALRYPT